MNWGWWGGAGGRLFRGSASLSHDIARIHIKPLKTRQAGLSDRWQP